MKKIVICASRHLYKKSREWKKKLENMGYEVLKYPEPVNQDSLKDYQTEHTNHYREITETDILFILNLTKDKKPNYIGPSVFAEIAFAVGLNISLNKKIKIYYLNPLPDKLPCSEELKLWQQLGWINPWRE